jgi:hypothetical protein
MLSSRNFGIGPAWTALLGQEGPAVCLYQTERRCAGGVCLPAASCWGSNRGTLRRWGGNRRVMAYEGMTAWT